MRAARFAAGAAVALLVAWGVRAGVGHPSQVRGHSMKPTLRDGGLVWIDELSWRLHPAPRLGEVLAYRKDGSEIVKRVVALAGESVEVREGLVVHRDREAPARYLRRVDNWQDAAQVLPLRDLFAYEFEEELGGSHLVQRFPGSDSAPRIVVPAGQVFMLGDNRDDSIDSRAYGAVPISAIEGRVRF